MKTMRWSGRVRMAVALLGMSTLLGCGDLLGSPKKDAAPEAPLGAGIHPVLVVASESGGAATLELHLKRVDVAEKIASFQGELKYDAQKLTLGSAAVAPGITGAWNEVEKGRVRFAGVSMEGIEGSVVLTLSFRTQSAVRAEQFELKMEELVASVGFADLAPQLQQQGIRPALSRSRPE